MLFFPAEGSKASVLRYQLDMKADQIYSYINITMTLVHM